VLPALEQERGQLVIGGKNYLADSITSMISKMGQPFFHTIFLMDIFGRDKKGALASICPLAVPVFH
jgi:hypothetical protein